LCSVLLCVSVASRDVHSFPTRRSSDLEADIRVLPREDGSDQVSAVYLGVATYDAEGKELRSGPGTYRYAGASDRKVSSEDGWVQDRKSTRLNSSHVKSSYAVFCLKKKK